MKDDAVEPGLDKLATESPNPRTADLDQLDTLSLVQRINAEDAAVAVAVQACNSAIAAAVDAAVTSLRAGGGVHYFGAGTSGRLGVLDASEIPPTTPTRRTSLALHSQKSLRCPRRASRPGGGI